MDELEQGGAMEQVVQKNLVDHDFFRGGEDRGTRGARGRGILPIRGSR